jgi:hypothetical protein
MVRTGREGKVDDLKHGREDFRPQMSENSVIIAVTETRMFISRFHSKFQS